ncbi:T9SS type A sorting domain-containing protein [Psychroserpens damuponensis]|uniref:T9SS type A sorting domain-containing protein n=1 Tax=Psychroserpens damuponensis TaxID=943936 RepID=UPI00058C910B|nr:T9SS type A sorting domain-containing protein [Psychroserpens damuponensis]
MIKRVLFLVFITVSFSAFAQLTVTNSSYIFVDGSGFNDTPGVAPLYVTEAVNLTGADSHIYLRNEAQLIQGDNVSTNSGIGELSIQQTGTANTFAYNFWCSPVGNNSIASGNEINRVDLIDDSTGLITSNDALFNTGYDGLASPLTISSRWLYTYVASDEYADWNALDSNSAILPGLGFTMKGIGGGGQLYDFRGKPNNGTITNNILAENFTLIGNPYPSAIDALLLIHDPQNTNIEISPGLPEFAPTTTGVLYYWEQTPTNHNTANYVGGYGAYTISAGGVETFSFPTFYGYDDQGNAAPTPPGPGPSKIARRYIPIGQGFMVKGAAGSGSSTIYVKNSHRVYAKESSGNSYFFRNDGDNDTTSNMQETQYNELGLNLVPSDFKRFRLNINFNQDFTRQLVQNFHHTATDGFDYGLEAPSSDNTTTDATWTQNDEDFVIQAHAFDIEKRIPVIIKAENQQPIEFSIFDVQNFDTSQPIYIHDIENDIYVNLRAQNYTINVAAGNYTNRFEITFQPGETLHLEDITNHGFDVFQNSKNSQLTVLNPNELDIKTVTLFDVSGKLVLNSKNVGSEHEYHFSTKSLSEGVYIATVMVDKNQAISKKVVIKN